MSSAKPCRLCGHNKTAHKWDRRPGLRHCVQCGCDDYAEFQDLGDLPPGPREYTDHMVSTKTLKSRIAAGIRQYCSDLNTELAYHEPARDTSLLQRFHDDAEAIARYIIREGL